MTAAAVATTLIITFAILWLITPALDTPYHQPLEDTVRQRVQEIRAILRGDKDDHH